MTIGLGVDEVVSVLGGVGVGPMDVCHLYQDNLKILSKSTKTKQVKHFLSKINLAQQYFADRLYIITQI